MSEFESMWDFLLREVEKRLEPNAPRPSPKCRKHKIEKIKTHSYLPYKEHWTCMECMNEMIQEDNKQKALARARGVKKEKL